MEINRTLEYWKRQVLGRQSYSTPAASSFLSNFLLIGALVTILSVIIVANIKVGGSTMYNPSREPQSDEIETQEEIVEELPIITVPASCGMVTFSTCWSTNETYYSNGLPVFSDYDGAGHCGLENFKTGDRVRLKYEGKKLAELDDSIMVVNKIVTGADYPDTEWGDNLFNFKTNEDTSKIPLINEIMETPDIMFACYNSGDASQNMVLGLKVEQNV